MQSILVRRSRASMARHLLVGAWLFCAAAACAAPTQASAATTIGSDLASEPDNSEACGTAYGAPCTIFQISLEGRQTTAPFDGVIVRWRVRTGAGSDPQNVRLRVAQTGYCCIGSSDP